MSKFVALEGINNDFRLEVHLALFYPPKSKSEVLRQGVYLILSYFSRILFRVWRLFLNVLDVGVDVDADFLYFK